MSVAFSTRGGAEFAVFAALPQLDGETARAAMARLEEGQLRALARLRALPVATAADGRVLCAAVDDAARRMAAQCGWRTLWRLRGRDFSAALQEALGPCAAEAACEGLARARPDLSAARRLDGRQKIAALALAAFAAVLIWLAPHAAGWAAFALLATLFLLLAALRLAALLPSPAGARPPRLPDGRLPLYTVLVPLYRETAILDQTIAALAALDYPAEKLDVKLIIEASDAPMRKALSGRILPACFEVIMVPDRAPRTKPRALNHALAFARGELLTIYDAEDIPHPRQLRTAAEHFAAASPEIACLQARLSWYNAGENWLTRMIAAEYAGHFDVALPFLAASGWPMPLGGTSNHFRVDVLRAAGGWDPHNVTEDADLGFRLARLGWRVGVLPSITWEEACVTWRDWRAQRARWIKGWLQTWLTHTRAPADFLRRAGWPGAVVLHAMMGAGVFAALAHPFFLVALPWSLTEAGAAAGWSAPVSALVLASGYAAAGAVNLLGMARRGLLSFWRDLFTLPLWWLLISAAAWMALWDFLVRPHHWRKTPHGRSQILRGRQDGL